MYKNTMYKSTFVPLLNFGRRTVQHESIINMYKYLGLSARPSTIRTKQIFLIFSIHLTVKNKPQTMVEVHETIAIESSLLVATNNGSAASQQNNVNRLYLTSMRVCYGGLLLLFLGLGIRYSLPGMSRALVHHPHRLQSMIVKKTATRIEHLNNNPLREFVNRSARRGACHADGSPSGFPMPWSMSLGLQRTGEGAAPALRSTGIQGVTDKSIYFVCRGGPGGATGPPAGLSEYNASMIHLAGNYPGATFEEQWRAEGSVKEVTIGELQLHGLPAPDNE